MIRTFRRILTLTAFLLSATVMLAQDGVVTPPEMYCGDNFITVRLRTGIKRIEIADRTNNVVVFGAGLVDCQREYTLRVNVTDPSTAQMKLEITDCNDRVYVRDVVARSWNVDINKLGRIRVGESTCSEFQIRANATIDGSSGGAFFVDSITVDDPHLSLRLPGAMPVAVRTGETYRYRVCFVADKPGRYKFPVTTWIRRTFPTGGLTTYAVADTGLLIVDEPPPPPHRDSTPVVVELEPTITDPTTFRSIAVPNAVIPPKGRLFAGSYDLLGLTAGYSITDNVMLIAGGALPTPDDWAGIHGDIFGAYSIGAKAGARLTDQFDAAVGLQWGRSFFDRQNPLADTVRSTITVTAPYAALSYGNDDSRISLTAGYAVKHHEKPNAAFDLNAAFFAIGGDHRIGKHWKIAGEFLRMETVGVVPLVATARYFDERFAVDAGLAYVGITTGDTKAPAIPVVPVVSVIVVF